MWTQAAMVAVGTAMTAAGTSAAPAPPNESRPVLAVSIVNLAHVSQVVVERAAEDLTMIYELAGVSVVWNSPRSTACEPPATGHWVRVVLYGGRRSEALGEDVNAGPFTMGFTPCAGATTIPCTIAYLFFDRIEEMARSLSIPAGRLLGLAIAHEIGHMLLPRPSHSTHGIMRPVLDRGRSILPQFTAAQADAIRARLDQNK